MAKEREGQTGRATEVPSGLVARITSGARAFMETVRQKPAPQTTIDGNLDHDAMGPGQPIAPVMPPGTQVRRYDYPVGVNYQYIPRGSYESVSFSDLRALAAGWDLLRAVIETRKDQLSRITSDFVVQGKQGMSTDEINAANDTDPRIPALKAFFRWPDGEHTYRAWQRMILEDLFVIDAPSILPRWRLDGGVHSFEVIDGATINVLVDAQGRRPRPPSPGYRQIIHGLPWVDLMGIAPTIKRDQLIYIPRNVRANKLYGYSPVEQIITTINIAIRRQMFQLDYYTSGTVPDCMIELPDTWTPDQITQFEGYWNSKFADQSERRKASFLPLGSKVQWTKTTELKDEYDEWLARLVCFAFSLPPNALIKQLNRASAQKMSDDAKQEGLEPLMAWWTDFMNILVQDYIGFTDIDFTFGDVMRDNPLEEAQINDIYVRNGVKSIDEVREDLDLEEIGADNAIITMSGPVPVVSSLKHAEETNALPVHDPMEIAAAAAAANGGQNGAPAKPGAAGPGKNPPAKGGGKQPAKSGKAAEGDAGCLTPPQRLPIIRKSKELSPSSTRY